MKKSIKILGSCCSNCDQLVALVKEVVNEKSIDASVEKITDIEKIMAYDVMSTPALVIDETVKIKGRVPSKNEILEFLSN